MDQKKGRETPSTFYEDIFTRHCIDEQRTFATALDALDKKSIKFHHDLLDASRKAHEQVYRAAEAERIRAEEIERRERLQRIARPPDPLPPPPSPPRPPRAVEPERNQAEGTENRESYQRTVIPPNPAPPTSLPAPVQAPTQAPVPAQEPPLKPPIAPAPQKTFTAPQPLAVQPLQNSQAVPRPDLSQSEHGQYLEIHKRLKYMREAVVSTCKKTPALKSKLGDMRRDMTIRVGQLSTDKSANKKAIERIQATLQEARRIVEPRVDAARFLISPPSPQIPESGIFVYLLSILSKKIIAQLAEEAGRDTKRAEPVGTMAATIFSTESLKSGDRTFMDILIAKYHVVCPVLFGVYGSEGTRNGRKRLGWLERDKGSGNYISENEHNDRMTGLGAGYASLSLRDFSKSTRINPYPSYHFWRALARVLNTPKGSVTTTHVVTLRGMLENYISRFIRFYGHPAYVALRKALVEYPMYAPQGPAVSSLEVLKDILKKDEHLTIA